MKTAFDRKFEIKLDKEKGYANLSIKISDDSVVVYKVKLSDIIDLISMFNQEINS